MTDREGGSGGILRLRNLAMIENIRRAEDPAWRERLERQQVVARLGRMFGRAEDPLQAMCDHAQALKAELRRDAFAPAIVKAPRGARWLRGSRFARRLPLSSCASDAVCLNRSPRRWRPTAQRQRPRPREPLAQRPPLL